MLIAVALMGFWALSQVGFGPADDPSAQDDEDVSGSRAELGSSRRGVGVMSD